MSNIIPSPPELKPTIIQMQNASDSSEVNAESCSNATQSNEQAPKKRRRRSSSSLISQSEIEKRRREHKTAHSIIEKKRRIRMNREFEALKYMVPACRNNLSSSNNNGEGMYKLTILQATVDYIKYLHDVINIQNSGSPQNTNNLSFAKFDIDTESYRDVENDFDFNKLFDEASKSLAQDHTSSISSVTSSNQYDQSRNSSRASLSSAKIRNNSMLDFSKLQSLPSPIITPELYPTTGNAPVINTTAKLSTSSSPEIYTQMLKPDFQFPRNSSTSVPPEVNSKLDIIDELGMGDNNHEAASSVHALLSMKKDGSVTSIKSLLN